MFVANKYIGNLTTQHLLEVVLCPADIELNGYRNTVWGAESSLGNPRANAILEAAYADVALVTSGHHLKHFW